jgi:hypothetical protein
MKACIIVFDNDTADRHWKDAPFPNDHYRLHMLQTYGVPPGLIFQPPLQVSGFLSLRQPTLKPQGDNHDRHSSTPIQRIYR